MPETIDMKDMADKTYMTENANTADVNVVTDASDMPDVAYEVYLMDMEDVRYETYLSYEPYAVDGSEEIEAADEASAPDVNETAASADMNSTAEVTYAAEAEDTAEETEEAAAPDVNETAASADMNSAAEVTYAAEAEDAAEEAEVAAAPDVNETAASADVNSAAEVTYAAEAEDMAEEAEGAVAMEEIREADLQEESSSVNYPESDGITLRIGAAVMASGSGKRFGSNKLLADAGGVPMIERVLDLVDTELFDKRNVCVVTRYREVEDIAKTHGFRSIVHSYPCKSDTVRFGTEALAGCDGIMFFQADQFLLSRESIRRLAAVFEADPEHPARLYAGDRAGSPVIFPPALYADLTELEGEQGGARFLEEGPVSRAEAVSEYELLDADTPEELEEMLSILSKSHNQNRG